MTYLSIDWVFQCYDCESTQAFKTVKALVEHVLGTPQCPRRSLRVPGDSVNKRRYRKRHQYDQVRRTVERLQLKKRLDAVQQQVGLKKTQ